MVAIASSTFALIVAAGRGVRAGGGTPKQYQRLAGRAVLHHSARAFRAHPAIGAVRVVIHPDDRALYDEATAGLDLLDPVPGGAERQDSVRLGLESLAEFRPARVLIHDAARPLVSAELIDRTIQTLDRVPGAIAAVALADTLKRGDARLIAATVPRDGLWRAQTPQGFHFDAILAAHRARASERLTDDAMVAERQGMPVELVDGSEDNFKITTADDLARAEAVLARRAGGWDVRTATGFDVHRFGPGDQVMLAGIPVAHDQGLIGHSDADVALHALTDALLGTIGAGDIGQHFPPSDPQWRGVDSARFLQHAAGLIVQRGGTIIHVDLTIICERPKVGPYRAAMVARIAELLRPALVDSDATRISVKATTTEGLGFTGRREGIAAQAAATIRLVPR
ncbi:MAG: bifunctional 2-C-methyl-D-erythritol 4-phosphate cytidylyltransferase/2-C-methyl-D-erythritol 2,4-cyclodiphosphate synthase [Alphaproteobacteria bacterium]|nr:bifunctional 2-C-methyl-D-erythritol 4-phosphate cytidylyltransferase/2-C-methyl-D-erythritol 2,4-cyclodiphosphate synthase [Alphaproteobacteria bacterium]